MKSRGTHFDRASKALYNDIMNDSNLRSKFTEAEIAIFKEGGVPKAYTWHHHQDEGVERYIDKQDTQVDLVSGNLKIRRLI